MIQRTNHIIEKQHIDVTIESEAEAFLVKDQLALVCRQKLLPALEKLFNERAPVSTLIRADRIVIDIGEIPRGDWESKLVEKVIDELTRKLSSAIPLQGSQGTSKQTASTDSDSPLFVIGHEEDVKQSLFYFLKSGNLPWHSSIKTKDDLFQAVNVILENKVAADQLIRLLQENEIVAERFILQFNDSTLQKVLAYKGIDKVFAKRFVEFWSKVLKSSAISVPDHRLFIYCALFLASRENKDQPEEFIISVLQRLTREEVVKAVMAITGDATLLYIINKEETVVNDILESVQKWREQHEEERKEARHLKHDVNVISKKQNLNEDKEEQCWYINNAGMVILNPFIPMLFEQIGYLNNKEWISSEVQQRAALLLHYLTTGEETCPEFNLILNKIITGYPQEQSLPIEIELSEHEKNEANDVLHSVINHWPALKNTSVDGLRSTFLQREGKLSQTSAGWLLQVEQRTVDILINKLPWGFSIIKTPWMDKMMHVEWT